MLVVHQLECQCGEWFVIRWQAKIRFVRIWVDTFNTFHIEWTWEVMDYRVQKRLNTLVLEGRTTKHWVDLHVNRCLAKRSNDLVTGEFLTAEILLHEHIRLLSSSLYDADTVLISQFLE